MANYSDKYLFEFETKRADATANQLNKISTNAKAAATAIRELAAAYQLLAQVSNFNLPNMGKTPIRVNNVNASGAMGNVNVDSMVNSSYQSGSGSGGGSSTGSASGGRSTYLRSTAARIADYTKFWLIGWGINQAVQLISKGVDDWAASQAALSQIVADFEVSLNTTGTAAKRYAAEVLAISRATGISMTEIGPGLVIQSRVKGAPPDLALRAAQVQRVTGADNYSVERDLLSLSKQFPDKTTTQILDAFTGAMRRSSLTAAEFFDLLESSGPLARQFNTSMESIFGVFAGLSTASGESGPAIELFIRQMERVYTDAGTRGAVEKYTGPVSFTNPQTGYEVRKPWDEIMREVSKLSQDAQNEIAQTIPNMLGQQTRQLFLALMKDWQGSVEDAMMGAKTATGEFESAFTRMSETWGARTQAMSTAWESFLATIQGSESTLAIIDKITEVFNYGSIRNLSGEAISEYNLLANKANDQFGGNGTGKRMPTPEELYTRETGMLAQVPFKDKNLWQLIGEGTGISDFHTPEYYEWAAKNLGKYTDQAKGKTGPGYLTDYQKRGAELDVYRGFTTPEQYKAEFGKYPAQWAGPQKPPPVNPWDWNNRKWGRGSSYQFDSGLIPTYLDDQKLSLKKDVTAPALRSEMGRIIQEIIAGYRGQEFKDVTGKIVRPYEKMDEKTIMERAGYGTQSPLMIFDQVGKPVDNFVGNIGIANMALDNLAKASENAATSVKTTMSRGEWESGGRNNVMQEYNRLVNKEINQARSADPSLYTKTDSEVKKIIGINEQYISAVSDTGTTLQQVAVDANVFAVAVGNISKAMVGLEYFDPESWMGESSYVSRLQSYSKANLAIQTKTGKMQDEPQNYTYVGPSGQTYNVWGNKESLTQAEKGIGRDERAYDAGVAAQKKGNDYLQKINDGIANMVQKLLEPTPVTTGDLAAGKLGKYQEKWDEPVRRVRDVVGRRERMIPNMGPWADYAKGLGIDFSDIPQAQYTGAEFERKFYNGLMPKEFYEQNSKAGFIASAKQMVEEKQGRQNLANQATGWLQEAGINKDMAKLISREMTGDMSPIESYWRGGKTDAEIQKDMGALGKTSGGGILPGAQQAVTDAKPVDMFVESFGLDKKENKDKLYKLGESMGGAMVGGVADKVAAAILPEVTAKVIAAIQAELGK